MKAFVTALLATLPLALPVSHCNASPVLPGLHGKHPLSETQIGELLIGELRCSACHAPKGASPLHERSAPDLTNVGSRVAPGYLRQFIASPSLAQPGTTMPDLLVGETDEQRNKIADAITHFLVAQSSRQFQNGPAGDASTGKTLFHSVGCVACHSPRDDAGKELTREGVVALGHVSAKYSPLTLAPGHIANVSVSLMPVVFSASSRFQRAAFSE